MLYTKNITPSEPATDDVKSGVSLTRARKNRGSFVLSPVQAHSPKLLPVMVMV